MNQQHWRRSHWRKLPAVEGQKQKTVLVKAVFVKPKKEKS